MSVATVQGHIHQERSFFQSTTKTTFTRQSKINTLRKKLGTLKSKKTCANTGGYTPKRA